MLNAGGERISETGILTLKRFLSGRVSMLIER